MSKVRLIERDLNQSREDDPTKKAYRYKWEVLVPAVVFGKRIRKYFKTKGEAKAEKLTKLRLDYMKHWTEQFGVCVGIISSRNL